MIICHCARITDAEIRDTCQALLKSDPLSVLTPSRVFRTLGRRADCGGCLPQFLKEMRNVSRRTAPDLGFPQIPCCEVRDLRLLCPKTGQACGEP